MRANQFIFESAVEELEKELPNLKKIDYDSIDKLMTRVSVKHGIDGKELHDLFMKKHNHTPDFWIKKYKEKNLNEDGNVTTDDKQVEQFVQWCIRRLHITEPYPQITLSDDNEKARAGTHTGLHTSDGHIWVYTGNRNLIDIFRTIFHELVHHRQEQLGMIGPDDSYPGSPIEAMADMLAGKYIKIYGKKHPEIFQ